MSIKIAIFDLEGTLTKFSRARQEAFDAEDWVTFHRLFPTDGVNEKGVDLYREKIKQGWRVFISTGKILNPYAKQQVLDFFRLNEIPEPEAFYSRSEEDDRRTVDIKVEHVHEIANRVGSLFVVDLIYYDDQEKIVRGLIDQKIDARMLEGGHYTFGKRQKIAVVTGAAKGLGNAIFNELIKSGWAVYGIDKEMGDKVDVTDQAALDKFFRKIGHVDLLVNCAGVNGIDYLENHTEGLWDNVMDTNTKGIFLTTKAALSKLKIVQGTVLNIVSNAYRVPMTASIAYNASKGAAAIMTKQMARELYKRHGITVFGINPAKIKDTGMSDYIDDQVVRVRGWTKEFAQEYQLNGILIGEEIEAEKLAEFIGWLVEEKHRHKHFCGCLIDYGE